MTFENDAPSPASVVRERRGELLSIRDGSVCRPRRRLAGAYERGDSREIIRTVLSEPDTFAVILKERPDEPVGSIGVFPTEAPEIGSEPEIGYWIGRPFWGQGLIPEAVRELLRYCFEDKGAQRVWCSHYAGNEKSKRVIEKCGFSLQLTCERPALVDDALRPTLFYALTKEKWEKTR